MPIAAIVPHFRCTTPHKTACRTDRNTLCQLVWNTVATSCQASRFAQAARNQRYVVVKRHRPLPHGTRSTLTPHRRQSTRRMRHTKYTASPHKGTNSKRRGASRSYWGPRWPQPAHTGRLPRLGRRLTASDNRPLFRRNRTFPYTKDLCFSTRLRIVFSCIL